MASWKRFFSKGFGAGKWGGFRYSSSGLFRLPFLGRTLLLLLLLVGYVGCSAADFTSMERGANDETPGGNYYDSGLDDNHDPNQDIEDREEVFYRTPKASKNYVYVANTTRDSVVRMDPRTLSLKSIPVGSAPTVIATLPDRDVAVVLNSGSHEVSIIRTGEGDVSAAQAAVANAAAAPGDAASEVEDRVVHLPITPHYNMLVPAPAGNFVLAFFSQAAWLDGEGFGGLQDLSVVVLEEGDDRVIDLSVGLNPSGVAFGPDGKTAYVVTDDGISIIDLETLDGPGIVPPIPLGSDPLASADSRRVRITSDGKYAIVYYTDQKVLSVVDLVGDGGIVEKELDAIPSDVAITADGSRVMVVLRQEHKALLFELPDDLEPDAQIREIEFGQMVVGAAQFSSDGSKAVMFTTIAQPTGYIAILDVDSGESKVVRVQDRQITNVVLAPDDRTAMVFHAPNRALASQGREFAYSLIDLESGFARVNNPEAALGPYLFSADGSRLLLALDDPAGQIRLVKDVNLRNFVTSTVQLGSSPEHLGELESAGIIFINQDHPAGRITFMDIAANKIHTVTGFELNEQIR